MNRLYQHSAESSEAFAEQRAAKLTDYADRVTFWQVFVGARNELERRLWNPVPLDIEHVWYRFRDHDPVREAAYIEALASLRAEGLRI